MPIVDLVPDVGSDLIDQMARGHELTQILLTGVHYELFDKTINPATAPELAQTLGADGALTEKFLLVLTALRLLDKNGEHFCNTKDAELFLTRKSPFYQGNLIRLVAQGKPGCVHIDLQQRDGQVGVGKEKPFESAFNREFVLAMAEAAMRGTLQKSVREISLFPEFVGAQRLLDLGGGHGLYGIAFAQLNPRLKVTVFDLPGVVEVARENIAAHGLESQVRAVEGDFNKDVLGENFDIVFASDIFYRPAEAIAPVLKKVYAALKPGGIVILKHWFYNEEGTGPLETALFDFKLSIRGNLNHHIYKQKEFISLLEATGFEYAFERDISISAKPSLLVVGRKA
ncbi:MAG: methyltransferase [Bacillota bacterium]